jgi:hypothetical protein
LIAILKTISPKSFSKTKNKIDIPLVPSLLRGNAYRNLNNGQKSLGSSSQEHGNEDHLHRNFIFMID